MTPNFGQQPRLIVTIQPAGARFDPPAKITYPNVEGLAPGESTDLYSFDHDLGHFVSIGPGTVSDDGHDARFKYGRRGYSRRAGTAEAIRRAHGDAAQLFGLPPLCWDGMHSESGGSCDDGDPVR